ncbi:hypothetical protein D3C87_1158120 [compost metagenome]
MESKPIVVVTGDSKTTRTLELMSVLGATGMFGGVHAVGDKIKQSEAGTEARIARAGVEAQLAKEAVAKADAKRERRRLRNLALSEKK